MDGGHGKDTPTLLDIESLSLFDVELPHNLSSVFPVFPAALRCTGKVDIFDMLCSWPDHLPNGIGSKAGLVLIVAVQTPKVEKGRGSRGKGRRRGGCYC